MNTPISACRRGGRPARPQTWPPPGGRRGPLVCLLAPPPTARPPPADGMARHRASASARSRTTPRITAAQGGRSRRSSPL
ncbi:hypothetical protein HBB16_13195 [Pseudonocardia sp. MCCB 268]|nr:hypothetical protein [Pseudonocardia cytotoxica]